MRRRTTRDRKMTDQMTGWKNNRIGSKKASCPAPFRPPLLLFFQPAICSVMFRSRVLFFGGPRRGKCSIPEDALFCVRCRNTGPVRVGSVRRVAGGRGGGVVRAPARPAAAVAGDASAGPPARRHDDGSRRTHGPPPGHVRTADDAERRRTARRRRLDGTRPGHPRTIILLRSTHIYVRDVRRPPTTDRAHVSAVVFVHSRAMQRMSPSESCSTGRNTSTPARPISVMFHTVTLNLNLKI